MNRYTPGPWRVGDAGCTVFGPKTDKPAPERIASVTDTPFPSIRQRANARLIAAAPGLLEAAILTLKFHDLGVVDEIDWHVLRRAIERAVG